MNKTFRYRLYPTKAQAARLMAWESAVRWLWNIAHEQRLLGLSRQRAEYRYYSAYDQQKDLTDLRNELEWLADVPRNVCSRVLVDLDNAWTRCFKRKAGRPRWKKRGGPPLSMRQTSPQCWRIEGARLVFSKLGSVRAAIHRPLEGTRKTCAIKRDGDQWFAIVVCDLDETSPATRVEPVVAIDRGIANLVADSSGRVIPGHSHLERSLKKLARAQRAVARGKRGSNNHKSDSDRVGRIHRKIRRQREHALHVLSHDYAKSHGTVIVEKLHVKSMVRAGGFLARRIQDSGWGHLVEMLRYKLKWRGASLVEVPAAYSSQTCSACGVVDAKSRVAQAVFCCTSCKHSEHADVNAAKVLKSRWKPPVLPVEASAVAGLRSGKIGRPATTGVNAE